MTNLDQYAPERFNCSKCMSRQTLKISIYDIANQDEEVHCDTCGDIPFPKDINQVEVLAAILIAQLGIQS